MRMNMKIVWSWLDAIQEQYREWQYGGTWINGRRRVSELLYKAKSEVEKGHLTEKEYNFIAERCLDGYGVAI